MNYCKIENGIVTNVSNWESPMPDGWAEAADTWVQNDEAQIGWSYEGGAFAAPPTPQVEPIPVTPDQVRAEAQRRFMIASADARALNQVLGTPIPTAIVALSQAIIAKGEEIAAMTPVPQDYVADERWPSPASSARIQAAA